MISIDSITIAIMSLLSFPLIFLLSLPLLFAFINITRTVFLSPLAKVSGPKSFALTKYRLAWEDYRGTRTHCIHALHEKYGPVVRVGPNEISFNTLSALRTIYGAGSPFQRSSFYRMFDVYGRKNLFSFSSGVEHRGLSFIQRAIERILTANAERKKLLNHAYSKSCVLKPQTTTMIEDKTRQFLSLVSSSSKSFPSDMEIFTALHYFSMDSITAFLYGTQGSTSSISSSKDRALLSDILHPRRRSLSFFAVHFPRLTSWLYTRTGITETLITTLGLLPMSKPTTYTGIRAHALEAATAIQNTPTANSNECIATRLFKASAKKPMYLLDVASECADHFLAGIDTTSDTIMFAIFALSLPHNKPFQSALRREVLSLSPEEFNENGVISPVTADKLPYLDAVIKETLRLYAPIPSSEPRFSDAIEEVDGFEVPASTVVSMAPYSLHRNPNAFTDPKKFDPERWLGEEEKVAEMKRWFWAFSSGARMCIGMQ